MRAGGGRGEAVSQTTVEGEEGGGVNLWSLLMLGGALNAHLPSTEYRIGEDIDFFREGLAQQARGVFAQTLNATFEACNAYA